MINLLTPEAKKSLVKEYTHRLIILVLVMSVFLVAIGFVLLVPSYFLTLEKSKTQSGALIELQQSEEFKANEELRKTLATVSQKIAVLKGLDEYEISENAFQPFLEYVTSDAYDITIDQLVYEHNEDGRFMGARGVAGTRNSLLSLIEALKADEHFIAVDVPVSDFVHNIDVEFQMTIEINEDLIVPAEQTPEEVVTAEDIAEDVEETEILEETEVLPTEEVTTDQ